VEKKTSIRREIIQNFIYDFRQNLGALIGAIIIIVLIILAVFADFISPYHYTEMFSDTLKLPPAVLENGNIDHILGTDDVGRDILSRLIYGSRISLFIGFFVVLLSSITGSLLGLIAGYFGGWIDQIVMRFVDIMLSLPSTLMAIVIVSILGPSLFNTIIAVGVISLPSFIRIVRASVLVEKNKQYVQATKTYGSSSWRIMVIHILPNCMAPLIVQGTLTFSNAILDAAALGFLGLGAQPPLPEWGTMLADSREFIESAPWMVTLPGLCILVVVLSFNLLGDGLRDAFDPKVKKV
jgi:ABC-type dipeptide/oligopeptide/nickel transport system permease subunit